MLYHGTSLVVEGKGILLRGKPGAGKSDLALRLIHQGAVLIADDQTDIAFQDTEPQIEDSQGRKELVMRAPKALQGQLEVRGIGIVEVPFCKSHPLDLLIELKSWREIERLPEQDFDVFQGVSKPRYALDPFEISAVEKVHTLCTFVVS